MTTTKTNKTTNDQGGLSDDELERLKAEQTAKAEESKAQEIATLKAQLAEQTKLKEEAESARDSAQAALKEAEKEAAGFRAKLQSDKLTTLDLGKGEAQLTESTVLILANGKRVSAKAGDLLIVDASKEAERQKALGKDNRVRIVTAQTVKDMVAENVANGG